LLLGDYEEKKLSQNIYNRFYGSLEPLKNLIFLAELDISGTDINNGLELLPLDNLRRFFCARIRAGAKVEEIKNMLNLSEEEAESEEIKVNREKISKIRVYQFYAIRQRNNLAMQQAQNNFLQSLNQYTLAVRRIRHKISLNGLFLLINSQTNAVCIASLFPQFLQGAKDKLNKIKQDLIEEFEDLTRREIDIICRTQINFINHRNLLYQISHRWQAAETLIVQTSNSSAILIN